MPTKTRRNTLQKMSPITVITVALVALVVTMGLLLGLQYVGQRQNLINQAAQGQNIQLIMNGQTVNSNEYRVDFYLNTKGFDVAGTQITGKVSGVNPNEMSLDLNNNLNLQPIGSKLSQLSDGTQFTFSQFASLDKSKPVNTRGQELRFASATIKKGQGTTFTITIDQSKTAIPVIGNSSITLASTLSRTFTVGANNVLASAAPTPTPSSGNNPDNGLHRSCNEYCADKNECAAGYSCFNNKCRNPRNLNSESCSNPPTPQPTPKPTPIVVVPAATPRPASPVPTPVPSPVPSPSVVPSPTATASGSIYDENQFRTSPSPAIRKPSPSPTVAQTSRSTGNNRLLTAGLIILVALLIVVPAGIYFYRRVR